MDDLREEANRVQIEAVKADKIVNDLGERMKSLRGGLQEVNYRRDELRREKRKRTTALRRVARVEVRLNELNVELENCGGRGRERLRNELRILQLRYIVAERLNVVVRLWMSLFICEVVDTLE